MNQIIQSNQNLFTPPAKNGNAMVDVESNRAIAETQGAMVIAKKFPRDEIQAIDRIQRACTRQSLAESALYTYSKGGSDINGPSIRLAEAIAQNWGNLQFGIRELEQRGGESTVEAFAWDMETNTRQVKLFQVKHERHTKKGVTTLTDPRDIYELVANQGARRLRACILGIVPGDVVEEAVKACENTLKTKVNVTPELIASLLEKFSSFGVTKSQIEKRIQRRMEAITPALVVSLGKIFNSLKDGMSKASDWFEDVVESNKPKFEIAENTDSTPSNSVAETQEPPPFTPDTPQKELQLAIKDTGLTEAKFMAAYKKQAPSLVGKAKMVSELSDTAANEAMKDIDTLVQLAETTK